MFRYFFLALAIFVEGPFSTIVAGSLSTPQEHFYHFAVIAVVIILADLFADFFYYFLGRFAGSKLLLKFLTWKKVSEKKINGIHQYFENFGGYAVVLAKVTPGFGWPVILFAGSAKMNFFKFCFFVVPTSFVKSFLLLLAGYYLGKEIHIFLPYLIIVFLPFFIYLIVQFIKTEKSL